MLPFIEYSDENPEPKLLRYLRSDGDKVFWRNINPEYPDWYLFYDFGLKEGDETEVYELREDNNGVRILPVVLKLLVRDYYDNICPTYGPYMLLRTLKYADTSHSFAMDTGRWIIGIGNCTDILRAGSPIFVNAGVGSKFR